ncbi:MAG: hypothetical protein QOD04_395, partial [Pseudonocardiales bacterium]|nr:hypothetical protein [Pseudonocardiales bacterium]
MTESAEATATPAEPPRLEDAVLRAEG